MTEKKNVLIVSNRGFIGGRLENYLNQKGFKVFGQNSSTMNLCNPIQTSKVISAVPDGTHVVFLATHGRFPYDNFDTYNKNITMAQNLLASLQGNRVGSLVFTNTICIYGRPPAENPVKHTSKISPTGHYGLSKYVTEKLLEFNLDCPFSVLRIPGTYGPGDKKKSVVSHLIYRALQGEEISLSGNGNQKRDFLFVDDLLEIIFDLLINPRNLKANLSSGSPISIMEFAQSIVEKTGSRSKITTRGGEGGV